MTSVAFTETDIAKLIDTGELNEDTCHTLLQTTAVQQQHELAKQALTPIVISAVYRYIYNIIDKVERQCKQDGVKKTDEIDKIFIKVFSKTIKGEHFNDKDIFKLCDSQSETVNNLQQAMCYVAKFYTLELAYKTDKHCRTVLIIKRPSTYIRHVLRELSERKYPLSYWANDGKGNTDIAARDEMIATIATNIIHGYVPLDQFIGSGKIINHKAAVTTVQQTPNESARQQDTEDALDAGLEENESGELGNYGEDEDEDEDEGRDGNGDGDEDEDGIERFAEKEEEEEKAPKNAETEAKAMEKEIAAEAEAMKEKAEEMEEKAEEMKEKAEAMEEKGKASEASKAREASKAEDIPSSSQLDIDKLKAKKSAMKKELRALKEMLKQKETKM